MQQTFGVRFAHEGSKQDKARRAGLNATSLANFLYTTRFALPTGRKKGRKGQVSTPKSI